MTGERVAITGYGAVSGFGWGVAPFRDGVFSAPPLDDPGPYLANNRRWNPALRHNATMNVGFVDGHVESTADPLAEPNWRWDYVPR